jgi:hypothetical protein
MLRLPAIGAVLLALPALALATAGTPKRSDVSVHRDTRGELQDVDLAGVVATAQADTNADGLPTTWCGDELTTNDTAHAATPAGAAQFKVVYAYAADRPDRFAGWANALQANVAVIERFLSAEDGGKKALRFDMGTRCGPQYVDIQTVQLPGARSSYADDFSAIAGAVDRALGPASGPRDAIILADGLSGSTQEYGLGETILGTSGEVPGAANVHNSGGLTSVLFSRDGAAAPGAAKWGWWPEGMLHEMTHNLGAVQWGAPHSTEPPGQSLPQYGHCWQGADVMCYTEDSGAAHPMRIDCAALAGAIPESYDCGRDDYFNPAPAAGSYLATHWNTYDSAFLAPCGEIAPACGGGNLWVPTPPVATSPPSTMGNAHRGTAVVARPGVWSNSPASYAYRWQRQDGFTWDDISGATGQRYLPTSDDVGLRLRVVVVATNDDGSASAASSPTLPVGATRLDRKAATSSHKPRRRASAARAHASKKKRAKARAARKKHHKARQKRAAHRR